MSEIRIRSATLDDLGSIVDLLTRGEVGISSQNMDPTLQERYLAAFEAISADANNELIVVDVGDKVVGTMQLTFIPGITYEGGLRMHVEGVVVSVEYRNQGIGAQLMGDAISRARKRGCCVVQLMTPKRRSRVHRFYEKLGFSLTHEGAKLEL